ncbi:MAG: response regulator, partial [Thermodesulfobacteriota bacterium]|nr:response regulator [Thermodesulfobacteriota bacterium]
LLLEKARNMRVVAEDVVWNYSALLFHIVGVLAKLGAQKAGLSRGKDELQKARDALEVRVQERTAELKQEIFERKQAEIMVRKERDTAQKYLDISGVMFVVINSDRKVSLINKKGCEILGYREEDIIGKDWFNNFIPKRNRDKTIWVFESLMAGDVEPVEYHENPVLTKSSKEKTIAWHNCILRDEEGKILGTLGSGEDITERKQAEEELKKTNQELERAVDLAKQMAIRAQAANIAKSEFLANMSHEIRTPMNAVIGFTDILLDSDLNDSQIDYAETIRSSGNALLSVINDVLDFSKIEAGEMGFEEIDFDPELLAYDVCELTHPRIGSKPVEILCRIGDRLPSCVKGDPARFRQVLINLMGNSSKFTESGEIELSLDIEEEKDDQVKLHAAIRDTGIGIPKDKLSAIFSPFQQADGSTTRKYGGTGLGLSICKKISKLMGGDVWAERAEDCRLKDKIKGRNNKQSPSADQQSHGSIFHFTAWFKKAEDKEIRRFTPVSLSNKKALIIDDNQTNLDILTHLLELVGMRIVTLRNGANVIPTLTNALESGDPFDSCILDIQMPGMSGYQVVKQMRDPKSSIQGLQSTIINQQLSIQGLPLLALSSLMERDAGKCEKAGFDGFLSKPIRREKLYGMLERMIGKTKGKGKKDETVKEKIITQYSVREEMKHSVRILLAEDNPVNQKLAKMMLTKAGYQVEVADNGKEAVEKYTASPEDFDLIFMDIQMPEMDGLEATKAIRKREEQLKAQGSKLKAKDGVSSGELSTLSFQHSARSERVPIVAMTAHAMKGDREKCIEAGMDDYITKPIKRELVFKVLEKWFF